MKTSVPGFLLCSAAILFLLAPGVFAQAHSSPAATRSNSEQLLQNIFDEVRQLRIATQRMNATVYRSQILVERLRIQQEQVARLTHEFSEVREKISVARARQANLKSTLDELERQWKAGVKSGEELKAAQAAIEELNQQEQSLIERESQLSGELDSERASLTDLKARLDTLEREILPTIRNEEETQGKKRQ